MKAVIKIAMLDDNGSPVDGYSEAVARVALHPSLDFPSGDIPDSVISWLLANAVFEPEKKDPVADDIETIEDEDEVADN